MKTIFGVGALLAMLLASAPAAARMSYGPYYTDELSVSNSLEAHGVFYHYRHIAIDNASCLGLRRYGVKPDTYGLDKFHRFKCDLDSAGSHIYIAQVSTTTGPKAGYWYSHVLSITKEF